MSQNNELNRVKRIIRELSNKTIENGCTENEAYLAMSKVGELLSQFNLTMDEVSLSEEVCVHVEIDTGRKSRGPMDGIGSVIAKYTHTKVWLSGGGKYSRSNKMLNYFGLESDVTMAVYLYNLIVKAAETEVTNFKKTDEYINVYVSYHSDLKGSRQVATRSFLDGFNHRISSRLHEMQQNEANRMRERSTTGTSLVLLKDVMVEDAFKDQMGIKLVSHTSYSRRKYNGSAFASGQNAGARVSLNRPVNAGNGARAITG